MTCSTRRQFIQTSTLSGLGLFAGGFFSSLQAQIVSRFFKGANTWYFAIPSGHPTKPNSADYVAYLKSVSPNITLSTSEWSVPIYYADATSPVYASVPILETDPVARNQIISSGWNLNVPWPANAKPASYGLSGYRDNHMVIIRQDLGTAWDFFGAKYDQKASVRIRKQDLNGSGIIQPFIPGNCRVSPCPLLQGLVTYDEVQRGNIDHAIAYAVWSAKRGSPGVYPMVGPNSGDSFAAYAPWLGMRFQLDPSLNLDTLGLSAAGKVVCRALQQYGMMFIENNGPGSSGLYFEDLTYHPTKKWSQLGVSTSSIAQMPVDKLRLIEPVMSGGSAPPPPPATNVNVTQTTPPVAQPQTSQPPVYQAPPPTAGGGSPSGPSVSDISVPFLVAGVLGAALILGSD